MSAFTINTFQRTKSLRTEKDFMEGEKTYLQYTKMKSSGPTFPEKLSCGNPDQIGFGTWKAESQYEPTDKTAATQEYLIIAFWDFDVAKQHLECTHTIQISNPYKRNDNEHALFISL